MDDKPIFHIELGEANQHVAWTFGRLRYLSCMTKDQIRKDCLWEDFEQELKTTAYEAWQQKLSMPETWRYASRRIHAFMLAYGYKGYRGGYVRQENAFSAVFEDWQASNLPHGSELLHNLFHDNSGLSEGILRNLRNHPEGITVSRLIMNLEAPAKEVHAILDSLIKQGKIVSMKKETWEGHPPTLFFLVDSRIPEMPPVHTERYERIRQAYQGGKSLSWIAREYHHSFHTIYRAIRSAPTPKATGEEKELVSV